MRTLHVAGLTLSCLCLCAVQAQAAPAPAPPPPTRGARGPGHLNKPRPKPPFNLTGSWFVDTSFASFRFGPPYPKFKPAAQAEYLAGEKATAEGRAYKDYIGQCYPAGLPMIMTRVWPIAMVQLPTVIYMVSGFENAFRAVYLDGRPHSEPDIVVPSYNGESIGLWEGDTLVVDTTAIEPNKHTIDIGIPVSSQFHVVERIRMPGPATLEIKYIMTDPENWDGEWTSTKRWKRVDDQDITEVECLPDLDSHLPATNSVLNVR
jgi:hypothetical protein